MSINFLDNVIVNGTVVIASSAIAPFNISPLTITGAASGSIFNQIQNLTPGVSASTDISFYNDLGTIYHDIGINSSAFNGNIYSPKFNVVGPNDSYHYTTSANLVLGTTGSTGDLIFFTGGSLSGTSINSGNERMRIVNTNAVNNGGFVGINTSNPTQQLTVVGNVSATLVVAASSLYIASVSSTSTVVGSLTAKMPIYNASGILVGYIPIYTS
jgi:hypothetical protein